MNSLLVPTCRTSVKDKITNKKRIVKTSIADGRKAFLLQVPSMNDLHMQVQVHIDNCYTNNQSLQPLICVVSTSNDEIGKKYFVYYFDTLYKFSNIVKALDTCFKIFHTFNLQYPSQCVLVWTFFQKFIYEIQCTTDVQNPSLEQLISDLKN